MAQLDPPKALSVWRELAELHDAVGRNNDRDVAVRAALALNPHRGETRELAARGGSTVSAVEARSRLAATLPPSSVSASGVAGPPAARGRARARDPPGCRACPD